MIALSFFALAGYVTVEAAGTFFGGAAPETHARESCSRRFRSP